MLLGFLVKALELSKKLKIEQERKLLQKNLNKQRFYGRQHSQWPF